MADTRCSNSEYVLDVDLMIFEYAAYQAVDAELKYLKLRLQNLDNISSGNGSAAISNERQHLRDLSATNIENFDIFNRILRHNHPEASLSAGVEFNIELLELLVLFDEYINVKYASKNENILASAGLTRVALRVERFNELKIRHASRVQRHRALKSSRDAASTIFKLKELTGLTRSLADAVSLDDLIPRFIALSQQIAVQVGSVNEKWYTLAAEFMLQCSFQRIEILRQQKVTDLVLCTSWITDCFDWGATAHQTLTNSKLGSQLDKKLDVKSVDIVKSAVGDVEQRLLQIEMNARELFYRRQLRPSDKDGDTPMIGSSNGHDSSNPSSSLLESSSDENTTWTNLRDRYAREALDHLNNYHNSVSNGDDPASTNDIDSIDDIYERHPLKVFLDNLRFFIEGMRDLNQANVSGKPILVQIEEGGIEGLDEAEFQDFLDRVGLKVSEKRVGGHITKFVRWA